MTGIHGFVKPAEPLADTLDQVRDSSKPVKHPNCTDEVPDDRKSKFHIPESESSNSTGDDEATKANGKYSTIFQRGTAVQCAFEGHINILKPTFMGHDTVKDVPEMGDY